MIDFNLYDDPIQENEIDLIKQQIDLLFDTNPKEVLGSPEFGSQYDRYLYNFNISNESLKMKVLSDINTLELFGYIPEVDVYMLQGTADDIAIINISFYDKQYLNASHDDIIFEKTYKITK